MGVLGGVFVLKSGLRILIRAPEVPFLVPPKTPFSQGCGPGNSEGRASGMLRPRLSQAAAALIPSLEHGFPVVWFLNRNAV